MKDLFIVLARYNEAANKSVVGILNKLSNADREKPRKSYYGSLSGLARHILGGTYFFLGMLGKAVPGNAEAGKALAALSKVDPPAEGKLTDEQWKKTAAALKIVDKALVHFASALKDKDLNAPVAVDWYKGRKSVPLYFMLQNLSAHNTHHRGQVSQILDSLKIDNDWSGIDAGFLSE